MVTSFEMHWFQQQDITFTLEGKLSPFPVFPFYLFQFHNCTVISQDMFADKLVFAMQIMATAAVCLKSEQSQGSFGYGTMLYNLLGNTRFFPGNWRLPASPRQVSRALLLRSQLVFLVCRFRFMLFETWELLLSLQATHQFYFTTIYKTCACLSQNTNISLTKP